MKIVCDQPFPKVVRLIRKRAHVTDADVEQVLRIDGAVGKPRPVDEDFSTIVTSTFREPSRSRWHASKTPVAPPPTMITRLTFF